MGSETAAVLIDGQWRAAAAVGSFRALDPTTGEAFGESFPISGPEDVEAALAAAAKAAPALAAAEPEAIARFLDGYAAGIEANAEAIAAIAQRETALPAPTRLGAIELPRTVLQLRKAAEAVRARSWTMPVIDTAVGLRSRLGPLGKPVLVFGPNNFPLAYHGIAGSDFASAIAARNPVIAKGHPNHPGTGLALARIARAALDAAGLPAASVQLLHHFESEVGLRLCADARLGAIGFTGSRAAGLALKAAADRSGTPFYGELSAINPVLMLPGALAGKAEERAGEYAGSCLLGGGQFCTNPGLLIVPTGADGDAFVAAAAALFSAAPAAVVFSEGVLAGLDQGVQTLRGAGARLVAGSARREGPGFRFVPSLFEADAAAFLADSRALQTEAFGPVGLIVRSPDPETTLAMLDRLEGSLTGSVFHAESDAVWAGRFAAALRPRVGRLLSNRMPTGVAVSAAMNHGGPYPSTTARGFSSVGMPGAIRRFAALECWDHAPAAWLPDELSDANPHGVWRSVNGVQTQGPLGG